MNEEMNQELEIDLISLFKLLLRKWWLITIVTVIGLGASAFYAYGMLDDVYSAEASMIVQVTSTGDSDYTNLLTGQRLVDTYTEIATSNKVLDELIVNLDLDLTKEQLRSMISVAGVNDTLIIQLDVESTDAVLAKDVANEIVSIVKQLSTQYENLDNVEVLDVAQIPEVPSGPNRLLYVVVGILLGGMVGVGIVLSIEFLDRTIKTTKDVENLLDVRVLGAIPYYEHDHEEEV
jgi:capsular polysaccharide biosynthesis protein